MDAEQIAVSWKYNVLVLQQALKAAVSRYSALKEELEIKWATRAQVKEAAMAIAIAAEAVEIAEIRHRIVRDKRPVPNV